MSAYFDLWSTYTRNTKVATGKCWSSAFYQPESKNILNLNNFSIWMITNLWFLARFHWLFAIQIHIMWKFYTFRANSLEWTESFFFPAILLWSLCVSREMRVTRQCFISESMNILSANGGVLVCVGFFVQMSIEIDLLAKQLRNLLFLIYWTASRCY